jgi:hypothetical protein
MEERISKKKTMEEREWKNFSSPRGEKAYL